MFKLGNNGYSMTFENGYTVSVRWHKYGNNVSGRAAYARYVYDDGSSRDRSRHVEMEAMATDSVDAEVAVVDATGKFLETPFNDLESMAIATDTVIGWQSPNQVLKIMEWAAAL